MQDKRTLLIPGRCSHCGCTEERACPGGCFWVDPDQTLCSRCAGESIGPQMTHEEIIALALLEMRAAAGGVIRLEITPAAAMILLANVQLALRHPGNAESATAATARAIGETLEQSLASLGPGCAAMAAAGWNPATELEDVLLSELEE